MHQARPQNPRGNVPTNFQTKHVLIIAVGHFIHDVYSSFLSPWLPLLIKKLDLSLTLAGSLTIFIRIPSILNPLIGVLADRIDMRYPFIIAPAVTAVCMSLIGLAPSYAIVAMLLFFTGVSAAAFHVPGPVMISRVSGGHIGKGMSFFMTAGELARTIGPLVAVAAVSLWGFEKSYPVMSFGLLASALLAWQLRYSTGEYSRKHYTSLGKTWGSMKQVFVPLIFVILARALMVSSLTAFLPTFLKMEGKSLWLGGSALAILELSGASGTLTSGTLSDRLGRRFVLLGAMVLSPLLMLIFLFTHGWLRLIILVPIGFTAFSVSPVLLAIVQDHAPGMRATANGIYMGMSFVSMSGVAVLVGWLGDILGLKAAFIWSALLALVGIPVVFFVPEHHRENL